MEFSRRSFITHALAAGTVLSLQGADFFSSERHQGISSLSPGMQRNLMRFSGSRDDYLEYNRDVLVNEFYDTLQALGSIARKPVPLATTRRVNTLAHKPSAVSLSDMSESLAANAFVGVGLGYHCYQDELLGWYSSCFPIYDILKTANPGIEKEIVHSSAAGVAVSLDPSNCRIVTLELE